MSLLPKVAELTGLTHAIQLELGGVLPPAMPMPLDLAPADPAVTAARIRFVQALPLNMRPAEREEYLAGVHVGVLSVASPGYGKA